MSKAGVPDHPVDEHITKRWSPYAYSNKLIPLDDLRSIFEAARWAASCTESEKVSSFLSLLNADANSEALQVLVRLAADEPISSRLCWAWQ